MGRKSPETLQIELAVEDLAAVRRKGHFTKEEVVNVFLKRNPVKQNELAVLAELDRKAQAEEADATHPLPRVHQARELQRLKNLVGDVLRSWKEEEYDLHRRFAVYRAKSGEGTEYRWFEVRYASVGNLRLWTQEKREHIERVGITVEETSVILSLASRRGAQFVNQVYRDAMDEIRAMRERKAS